jgi:hypothetical protein
VLLAKRAASSSFMAVVQPGLCKADFTIRGSVGKVGMMQAA